MCRFARSIDELEGVLAAVTAFCREHGATDGVVFACELAVEELFTNFVKYNRGGGDHIRLDLAAGGGALSMTLTDFAVEPFDPAQAPPVDTAAPAWERRPGGLGLHLVRAYMDDLTYAYDKGTMRVTATKRLEADDVRHTAQ